MCNLVKDYALVQWSAFPHNWQTRMCTFLEKAEIEAFTWSKVPRYVRQSRRENNIAVTKSSSMETQR